jgi:hypothetical protein
VSITVLMPGWPFLNLLPTAARPFAQDMPLYRCAWEAGWGNVHIHPIEGRKGRAVRLMEARPYYPDRILLDRARAL